MRMFEGGATRDTNDNKVDYRCLSIRALRTYGEYMHRHRIQADGERRSATNYKKGIPADAYTESAIRHMMEFMSEVEEKGAAGRDVVCAVLFNLFGLLHGGTSEGEMEAAVAAVVAYQPVSTRAGERRQEAEAAVAPCLAALWTDGPQCVLPAAHSGMHDFSIPDAS